MRIQILFILLAGGSAVFGVFGQGTQSPVDYRKQIQPVLTASCIKCHQGKAAPAELSLDSPEGLLKGGTSGKAVLPGDPERSLLVLRISDPNSNNRMPPGGQLSAEQVDLIKRWISEGAHADASVDFVSSIQPIFRTSCYACHSGNDPKARLHLDNRSALSGAAGGLVIVPGDAEASRLVHRIKGEDGSPRMPLVGTPLTNEQIATIEKWIQQGANWPDSAKSVHWSYVKPVRPPVPAVKDAAWVKNPIDNFILARLEKEGLRPSKEATKETLVRRLYLDIIGIPPSPAQVDEFLADVQPGAYERLVDKLLASPHFGERMATPWLDLARYADSNGYERDFQRIAWPYRDWVIKAFNENKPFDQFTIEQLAGDLLPNATNDQKIATGFVRSSMLNTEGGTDPEEQNWVAQVDRGITVGNVWLGSTTQCAQCHNHKYDPFTQKQFYQMVAFFNNVKFDPSIGGYVNPAGGAFAIDARGKDFAEPVLQLATPEQAQKRDQFNAKIKELQGRLNANTPEFQKLEAAWEQSVKEADKQWLPLHPTKLKSEGGSTLTAASDASILVSGANPDHDTFVIEAKAPVSGDISGIRIEALPDPSLPRAGPGRDYYGNFMVSAVDFEVGPSVQQLTKVALKEYSANNGARSKEAGLVWKSDLTREPVHLPETMVIIPERPIKVVTNAILRIRIAQNSEYLGISLGKFRVSVTTSSNPKKVLDLPHNLRPLLSMSQPEREVYLAKLREGQPARRASSTTDDPMTAQWRTVAGELAPMRDEIADLRRQIADLKIPTALILAENTEIQHPKSFVHERGAYTAKGEEVEADVPAFLGKLPTDAPPNRLGLAKWLVGPDNPLTARVRVNQIWQTIFGIGIVETAGDFGTQGTPPSHPELLDWLATEFMRGGWDQKALIRLIVTSNAYQQSSKATPELLERDPKNSLLTRGPRFRVEAEMVRDIALGASGLLSLKIGGPPVMPPQPEGMWNIPFMAAGDRWVTSQGEDRYRRALYIFIRRTARYPSMTVLDAPTRETTTVRRNRANNPLQALTTLNDPQFFEAAQAMAGRIEKEGGDDVASRITYGFRLATSRKPDAEEAGVLVKAFGQQRDYFAGHATETEAVCGKRDPELAAWTLVSNMLLNLDETVTKE